MSPLINKVSIHRIVTTGVKRMTPEQSTQAHKTTAQRAISLDCLWSIFRAGGNKSAGWGQQRWDNSLI